jgi:hypothetical protein
MLKSATNFLVFVTVLVLGVSAGAMLGEQQTLVPFWQELSSSEFYAWYETNAARLKGFFAPLQIAGAVLAVMVVVLCKVQKLPGTVWMAVSLFFAFAVFSTFFLFFKGVNASFVAQDVSPEQLSDVLMQWSNWQWARITFAIAAFGAALHGASQGMLKKSA